MRVIRYILGLAAALLAAGGLYSLMLAGGEDRYSIFDLLKGRPVPGVIGQAPGDLKPVESESGDTGGQRENRAIDLNSTRLLEDVNRALADLTEAAVPSVVSIDTTTTVDVPRYDPFEFFLFGRSGQRYQRYQAPGLGSGVIVSKEGHVLTNHHVIGGVDEIQITTHDGEKYDAEWIGSDPGIDVAVLKILVKKSESGKSAPNIEFQALPFGDSDKVRVGDLALAIGNPFGLSETVTRGIISAKQRRLSDGANEYFQTDAVINPGNSGGPLVDVHGEIVGINVAIFSGQQEVRVWQGIGLAIPSNDALEVYEAIVLKKPLLRGFLGLELSELSRYQAAVLGLNSTRGALIVAVAAGSPAEKAGLKPGDVIRKFAGAEARSAGETLQKIRRLKSGETVSLEIFRKGKAQTIETVIAEKPDATAIQLLSDITASGQSISEALGLKVRDLTAAERQAFGFSEEDAAVLITDVKSGSQASQRFRPGDLVHVINRKPVRSVSEFYELLGSLPKDRNSEIILTRRGHRFGAILTPGR